ncbi:MAG: carbon-nitrogen hydrolase family protein [Pseudomonadota bacterium]
MDKTIIAALLQYEIQDDWGDNIERVQGLLQQAQKEGARLAVLPEMFNMPYDMDLVPSRAEPIPDGRTCRLLAAWSREFSLILVGGSIAELDEEGRFYNTATVWGPDGRLLAKHRKVHLFDVDLPDGVSIQESAVFSAGDQVTVVEVMGLKLGLAVCYDVRFPELFRLMALAGAEVVALPGAFNHVSGPAHWEMLLRARAVENTFYVAGVSGLAPAQASYQSWGHSMLVDPFGQVLVNMEREEGLGLAELDPARLADVRQRLPVLSQRRTGLYRLERLS